MSGRPFDFSEYSESSSLLDPSQTSSDQFQAPQADLDFGESGGTTEAPVGFSSAAPPLALLWAAAAAALVCLGGEAVFGDRASFALVFWILGGPVGFGFLAVFTARDTKERARSLYAAPNWTEAAYRSVAALSLLAVIASALRIALWVGRS